MDPSREGLLSPGQRFRDDREDRSDLDSDLEGDDYLGKNASAAYPTRNHNPARSALGPTRRFAVLRRPFRARSSKCLLVVFILLTTIWALVATGLTLAYHVYRLAPPDGQSPPWYPTPKGGSVAGKWAESYAKAARMVKQMTLPEKVNITTGTGWSMGLAVGTTSPVPRLKFPQLNLQDGPLGIRFSDNATAWPAGITVGATWSKELMFLRGQAHAREAKEKGINAILGPCVGPLGRMPAGGRNWEGFGADPYLQGVAGAETIKGIQGEGIMATIKHFVGNEQEHFRQSWEWGLPNAISSNIPDRALHELYAWPFADAVHAGVTAVMCSYNMVNNSYACANSKLLNGVLKDEMGFQGFVMSDWLAQRSGVASALSGLDVSMPGDGLTWQDGNSLWGPEMTKAVLNGSLPLERLDDMVTRVVASWYQVGQDNETEWDRDGVPNFSSWTDEKMGIISPGSITEQPEVVVNKYVNVRSDEHTALARRIAAEGTVLLKNEDGVLPLMTHGDGVRNKKEGANGKLRIGVFGEDAGPGNGPNFCKDRGCNQGTLGSGWGSGAVEFPYLVSPIEPLRKAFDPAKVNLTEQLTNTPPFSKQPNLLADQDLCLVFANADSGEGFLAWDGVGGDRGDLFLQKGGDKLIAQVARGCGGDGSSPTVVILHAVGPVVVERWVDLPGVKALVLANLPGQESGHGLADVLFGVVNPSGKLPYTMGKSLDDWGEAGKVMYLPNGVVPQQDFSEGLYIDYRHFDKHGIEPRYPFGFGLSYTTFAFSDIAVAQVLPKSVLPAPRPADGATPPSYPNTIPDKSQSLWPTDIRRFAKYIYPYLDQATLDSIGAPVPYPSLPKGYDTVQTPSAAGGAEGGNPDLWATYVTVSADVTNSGKVAGNTVVQLYLSYPNVAASSASKVAVDFPVKVLRGFEKIYLEPGETKRAEFNVTRRDLSYWDVKLQNWVLVMGGKYRFTVAGDGGKMEGGISGEW